MTMSATSPPPHRLGLWGLFSAIFRISATTLGGGAVMIGVIQQEMSRRGLLTDDELTDMITLSLSSPGAMANSMSFQVGWALHGPLGAVVAVAAMAMPPFITILVLAGWLLRHMGMGHTSAFFGGAATGLVVLMGSIVWGIIEKNVAGSPVAWAVCIVVASAMIAGLSPVWALFGGTTLSLVLFEWQRRRTGS